MKVEYKITTWESFSVEDEHKESLLAFLKENPEADAMEIYDWALELGIDPYVERIDGVDDFITPEENGGQATIEILADDGKTTLFTNEIME